MNAAAPIIRSLEQYHGKYGGYPPDLDALVPEFMDAIPKAPFGTRVWEYDRATKEGESEAYRITLRRSHGWYARFIYDSGRASWSYDS